MSRALSQATPTQVSPTPTPVQVIDGPIARSGAKKTRRVKNGPVVVKNGPVQRNLHNFLLIKAMKIHEELLESLSSLFSNESSGDQFGYTTLPADQN